MYAAINEFFINLSINLSFPLDLQCSASTKLICLLFTLQLLINLMSMSLIG